MLKAKDAQLLKMKGRLLALQTQVAMQQQPQDLSKIEQKFNLLKSRYLERELEMEEKNEKIAELENEL